MQKYHKSILFLALFGLLATFSWSQTPQRNMLTEGMLSNIENKIGDLNTNQENQFLTAYDNYVKASNQASEADRKQIALDYQKELKEIFTPQKYAILRQDPSMKKLPGFNEVASTH